MDWLKQAKKYEKEFLDVIVPLLQIPTVLEKYDQEDKEYPFGEPIRKALDFVLAKGKEYGFKTKDIDHYAGYIEQGEGEEQIGILGHLDVVPAGGKWTYPPFSATVKDGKIYARGSMDDKGPSVAALIAMKMIDDANIPLKKRIRLIFGCDEESGMRGVKRYIEKETMPDIGFAPDADFPLIYGEKGIFSFDILGYGDDDLLESMRAGERYNIVPDECVAILKKDLSTEFTAFLQLKGYQGETDGKKYVIYGQSSHAAWPQHGVNAVFLMTEFLREHTNHPLIRFIDNCLLFDHTGEKLGIDCYDELMKELTINTALVRMENNNFYVGCNIRYPRNYDFEAGVVKITEKATKYGLKFETESNSPSHFVSPDDPFVQTLYKAYQKYTNDFVSPMMTIGGGTYARVLKKAVAFGAAFPGDPDLAHQPDEYLEIDKLLVTAAIYAEAIEKLAGFGE